MITKKQAIEIFGGVVRRADGFGMSEGGHHRDGAEAMIEALDRAGAFPSEETLAEIAACVVEIEAQRPLTRDALWRLALRLASACRAAGLVPGGSGR